MRDYKLTLLDEMEASRDGFALNVRLDILKSGAEKPFYTASKRLSFRMKTPDAEILRVIEEWYHAQVDIHSARIAEAEAEKRLDALRRAVNRTETV